MTRKVADQRRGHMLIKEMTRQDSIKLLERTHLARLACALDGQPYITPLHCAYDDSYLYSFGSVGQKITWMRANPLVCVEFEELVTDQSWATVVVSGTYEELPDLPPYAELRRYASDLLRKRPVWWEPGYVKTVLSTGQRPLAPLYFRIQIREISGHRGIPEAAIAEI
jgi:nitroimidazol reductase NimA-like FMN-containing flavoprotein (pyridoxamine 5'-phosphate oxidase superfamily)